MGRGFGSYAFKILILVAFIVCLSVAATSWQNGLSFKEFIKHQASEITAQKSQELSLSINYMMTNWSGQISSLIGLTNNFNKGEKEKLFLSFIRSHPEYVGLKMVDYSTDIEKDGVFVFSPGKNLMNFGDVPPEKVKLKMERRLEKLMKVHFDADPSKRSHIVSLHKEFGIPVLALAVSFRKEKKSDFVWAILIVWQKSLLSLMVDDSHFRSEIIDSRGLPLLKAKRKPNAKVKRYRVIRKMKKNRHLSVVVGQYRDEKGTWLRSFRKVPGMDIYIMVEQSAAPVEAAMDRVLVRTSLWGILFVLLALVPAYFLVKGLTKTLMMIIEATKQISLGNFIRIPVPSSKDETRTLTEAVNFMSERISFLLHAQKEKVQIEKEMETAKVVQDTFFPSGQVRSPSVQVTGYYESAAVCGGDWWGHYQANDYLDYIFIGDATGHGLSQAFVTALCYAAKTSFANAVASGYVDPTKPSLFLEELNHIIYSSLQGSINMTFLIMVVNAKDKTVTLADASHHHPLLFPQSPEDSRMRRKKGKLIKKYGIAPIRMQVNRKNIGAPLGYQPRCGAKDQVFDIQDGDRIVLYTDGLIECTSPGGKMLRMRDFYEKILRHVNEEAKEFSANLLEEIRNFQGGRGSQDDLTVVTVDFRQEIVLADVG